ncbi:hypothetical protein C8A00DRAFT_45372 [Chaetomidium leptoderma]|uniref:Uncharacterized protein n=1 Tax=Chaetomidium leptoderma TaxID=669021 RepID=A0AAN6ZVA1_9PEZI|nr:hypothetical protein C8A00DRAFT_45372 [Chaetomidium leptoderma]
MSSTITLNLFALVASAAILLQLPTRLFELVEVANTPLSLLPFLLASLFLLLSAWSRPPPGVLTLTGHFMSWTVGGLFVAIDWLRNVGMFAEFVDRLLLDEERRSVLEPELFKLRSRYKKQQATLAQLDRDYSEACKEYKKRCRQVPSELWPRRQPGTFAAKYHDIDLTTEWSDDGVYTIVKMFYATDLKVVFLCAKVNELRSAILANDEHIRQLSTTLKGEQQAVLDLGKRIPEHKARLRREEAEEIRQAKIQKRTDSIWNYEKRRPYWFERAPQPPHRAPIPNFWEPSSQAIYHPVVAPISAPTPCFESEQNLAIYHPVVVPISAPAPCLEALFGCPQEALDMAEPVDVDMLDAPDLVEEDSDVSMMDVSMDVSIMDVEMAGPVVANNDEMVEVSYEPLFRQVPPVPALPALPFHPTPVSTVFADTAMEVEQEQPLLSLPEPLSIPVRPSAVPLAAAAAPKVNAQVTAANSGSRSSSSSFPLIDPRLFDAKFDLPLAVSSEAETGAVAEKLAPTPKPAVLPPPSPTQQQAGSPIPKVPIPALTQSTTPATINFDFVDSAPLETRRIAKPKSRIRRFQAQAPAAAPANAPAPVFPPASAPASAQAAQVNVPPAPVAAPQSSLSAPPSASDKGKGNASTSSLEAEPTCAEWDFVVLPGEILRALCEDWIQDCATFMSTSELCGNLSPRWIGNWKQSTLINLGGQLGQEIDEREYDQDDSASMVKVFFQYNLRRRMDGPDDNGKNAILRHVKGLAAKEGIDLGSVEI